MPVPKDGTYCLLLYCSGDPEITVGKLGTRKFRPGYYIYIGSALKNMDKRIGRHLKKTKKNFWHIDYLTSEKSFNIHKVYAIFSPVKLECRMAAALGKTLPSISGFGSSDCRCGSHLFFAGGERDESLIEGDYIIKSGFKEYNI